MFRESKLADLRGKTDRDLVFLLNRELNRGLTLAEMAATKEGPLFEESERAYQMVKTCLPLVSNLSRDERREMQLTLKELRSALDRVPSEKVRRHFANA